MKTTRTSPQRKKNKRQLWLASPTAHSWVAVIIALLSPLDFGYGMPFRSQRRVRVSG